VKQKTVLRVVRIVVFGAALYLVWDFMRDREKLTLPDNDASMEPTYPAGSTVVVQYLDEDAAIDRGTDVVYLSRDGDVTRARFGRIQGLPGDVVGAEEGLLTVNGEPLKPMKMPGEALGTVPPGHVLVLAINPFEERYPDSRRLGFIPRADVKARIRARVR